MTAAELKLSLALHERRHRFVAAKLTRARRGAHAGGLVTAAEASEIKRLEGRVSQERALIHRRREQIVAKSGLAGALFLPGVERINGNDAGTFVASGPKIVWHTTEGSSVDGAVGAFQTNNSWPHFTLDPATGRLVQHVPLNRAGRSLEHPQGTVETNRAHAIQVELVGFAKDSDHMSDAACARIAELARKIEAAVGVPRRAIATFTLTGQRLSESAWLGGSGHCGHQHVPHNNHTDPGALRMDRIL
ncbi:MAG: hypothetical protein QOJ35_1591 [Solirubrobacteraceae bacterium]|jgi:hypothetical protein|nr:hypothetical protein [Solirubrobacteraceae bacterium]